MGLNLEIKVKADLGEKLISSIIKLGGEFVDTLNQKDIYYKYSNGLIKLRKQNGEFSLIKYNRDEEKEDRWSNYSILKISGDNIEKYFSDIMDVEVTVEKRRDLYIYQNTRIHLDSVKKLGEYLELETVSDNLSESEAKKEFKYVLNALNLYEENEIRKSYRDLLFDQ